MRTWQREMDLGIDSEVVRNARRAEQHPEPIDLELYVATFLDSAAADGTVYATQDDALAALEFALSHHVGRSLNKSETVKVGLTLALAWNQRIALAKRRLEDAGKQLGAALSAIRNDDRQSAAALSLDALAAAHSEGIAIGELCIRCGVEFPKPFGKPTLCNECGGTAAPSALHVAGRYFASEADARTQRQINRERRERHARRVAQFFGEAR